MDEVMLCIAEALSLWSGVRFAQTKDAVRNLVTTMLQQVALTDEVLVLHLLAIIASSQAAPHIFDGPVASTDWEQAEAAAGFDNRHTALMRDFVDEESWKMFAARLDTFLGTFAPTMFTAVEFKEHIGWSVEAATANAAARDGGVAALLRMSAVFKVTEVSGKLLLED